MSNENKHIYTCLMHPEIQRGVPGICPICGMNLIPGQNRERGENKTHKEYEKHAGHSIAMFRNKFWISLLLTIPTVLYSELPQRFFGWTAPAFFGSEYISFVLGSIVFFYGGLVFIKGAWRELRAKLPGMMTLISLAISTAYLWSVTAILLGKGGELFWELTTLITVMLLGHWMEMKAVQGAQGALRELSRLLPDTAERIRGGKSEVVPLLELRVSDVVLVRPGDRIPADGIVVSGRSYVNEAMITGESKPVEKEKKSEVMAGTVNGDGALTIKITKIGEQTFLSGVMRLVQEAQASKSRLQILSDKAAFYLTLIAILSGSITFLVWFSVRGEAVFAIERFVAVLVVACPHALGLAIPLVASISTTLAARNGLLVRQRLALEMARKIDVVLFDKTGTLTKGEYGITNIITMLKTGSEEKILQLAASVDNQSEHFIARAIVKEAKKRKQKLTAVKDFKRVPGKGTVGTIGRTKIWVGGEAILKESGAAIDKTAKSGADIFAKQGKTIIYVIQNKKLVGLVALADIIREESREAIQDIKAMGVKIAMITGDSRDVAEWVSKELGIDEYFARVLPQEKVEKVKLLQGKGLKVAMVGDGINDAPALTQADLGIAIGAGTNVAIESAGIILVKNDPRDISKIIKLSRATYAKMVQNLFWATGYNIVAIPLAAGVMVSYGILLEPALSAILMSLSTVIVAVNAIFLKNIELS